MARKSEFECPFCEKTYEEEANRNRHVGQAHRAEKAAQLAEADQEASNSNEGQKKKRRPRRKHSVDIIEQAQAEVAKLGKMEEHLITALTDAGGVINRSEVSKYAKRAGIIASPNNLKAALDIITSRQPRIQRMGDVIHLVGNTKIINGQHRIAAAGQGGTALLDPPAVASEETSVLKSQRDYYKARCQVLSQIIMRLLDEGSSTEE